MSRFMDFVHKWLVYRTPEYRDRLSEDIQDEIARESQERARNRVQRSQDDVARIAEQVMWRMQREHDS